MAKSMIRFRRLPSVFLVLALVVVLLLQPMVALAQSVELSQDRLNEIRNRCSNAQISLQQLRKRDAVSRINRGRAYDQMMMQMSAFNSRLAYNNISMPELLAISSELQSHIDKFRSISDNQYLTRLENAIRINCKAQPAEFYDLIVKTREDRDKVAIEIDAINELMTKYRQQLVQYQASLPEAGVTQ